ncbi:DUF1707 domain-containing protein [Tessaracoccus antarcticus]|uniref:DUF1707 domain-containing protein n=1 Tax=Tessaracoccus antarcticus TaxID=2479848 RepID=UPI00389A0037
MSDVERDQAVSLLAEHFAEGRLTPSEFDQRTTEALSARTRGELDHVMVDLPAVPAGVPAPPAMDATPGSVDRQGSRMAHWRRSSLAPWAIFAVFFVVVWVATGGGYFWPVWPIMGWGLGVAINGVKALTEVGSPPTEHPRQLPGPPPSR